MPGKCHVPNRGRGQDNSLHWRHPRSATYPQLNQSSVFQINKSTAENWWVDSLIRNPFLIPYTLGGKRLDNLYLDTTYLRHAGVPPETFCSKAEGIAELLKQVQSFPPDTVFHLGAWTFGYEEVWLALAAALNAKVIQPSASQVSHNSKRGITNSYHQVHPDAYQLALYQSLGQANRGIDESATYNGFVLGNEIIPGCLTNDICCARIHLCVPPCLIANRPKTVYLRPFLGRGNDGFEMRDMGAGGGSGDVYQRHELDFLPGMNARHLLQYCLKRMKFHTRQERIIFEWRLICDMENNGGKLSISKYGILLDSDMPLDQFADLLVLNVLKYNQNMAVEKRANLTGKPRQTVIVSSFRS